MVIGYDGVGTQNNIGKMKVLVATARGEVAVDSGWMAATGQQCDRYYYCSYYYYNYYHRYKHYY